MFTHESRVRVRYAETDQMGVVYYGNYATYYEVARVEALRALGISYKEIEASGVMLPVLEYKIKYIRPAKYDELLSIKVSLAKMPDTRITFTYEMFNEAGLLLNVGETTLVFVDMAKNKPCQVPPAIEEVFAKWF
jgi:acyl-CoA thioester hydrolase